MTEEPLADEVPDEPVEPAQRRSRGRAAAALVLVTLLAVGAAFAWHWHTHPSAFYAVGNKIKVPRGQPGRPLFVTISDSEQKGKVRIERLSPNFRRNTAKATVEFFVCTIDPAGGVGSLGSAHRRSFDKTCPDPVPVRDGVELELGAKPRQEIVMAVTPHAKGLAVIDGADLTYGRGWQRGTQSIGIVVRLLMRDH